ncbi:hypothetical protein [Candidatus Nitrosotenuis uzonensis]|uniref:Uncharacterized protein n=1 Tax=Candidatus Nitrosotenuis uzonensis TaxID=1407055 RepID=A0A812EZP5_9ARCH|nr:hypothetical protein [Candidatus Nitrosotenuis uzonensis]CAE6488990.1 conserved hypothetical protein [Candidatus Nitrosotenuis uzonensis]
MATPKVFWSIQFTNGFKKSFAGLTELEQWRVRGFLRNIVHIKDPTKVYHHTACENCPPDFHLFGLSDDGLGNSGIEIQVWLHKKTQTAWFLKCRKATKPN